LEKVEECRKALVTLRDNFLELAYDYDVVEYMATDPELRQCALLARKQDISVGLTVWYPRVEIFVCGSYQEFIYVETMDEAYIIYNKIKNWLINE
jgi:hypothetical protein